MDIKNKVCILLCAFVLVYGAYLFAGVNTAVTTDSTAVIESEIANSQSYGQLYLSFVGTDEKNAPEILINGVSAGKITGGTKTLDIFDKCVVELDARNVNTPVMVQIDGKSENVDSDCVGRVVTGGGDIQNIGTFVINKGDKK